MQDTDGGFFAMVNPRGRRFENDVLPSEGDRQVVWPKSLIATGVAVGALAELANSPAFKRHYPAEAASFRAKAFLGWQFIERAVATHGVAGGHQQIYHYGATFQARDELAHAAAAMFAMTGDPAYEARLIEWMPYDPAIENHDLVKGWRPFRRFTWQRLYESAGAAMRLYAFANRGALSGNPVAYAADLVLGKTYLEHVIDEIKGAGEDTLERAEQSPYGVSVPIESKAFGGVSYIFAESEAFDLITASLLDPKPAYWKAVLSNVAYQAGGNPVNTSFISGLGWVQPRNFVSQWALNDEHQLPPIGLTTGSVNSALPFLLRYGSALGRLSYPPDVHESDYAFPFGTYHRYTDTFHVGNELVILDLARSMATTSFLMAQVPDAATAPWVAPPAVAIKGIPEESYVGEAVRLGIETTGDLTEARVLWEAKNGTIGLGGEYAYTPVAPAEQWIEAEVLWPSGLRSFARSTFQVREPVDLEYIENFQPAVAYFADGPYRKILGNDHVRVYYPLDGDVRAVKGPLVDRGVLFPALALFGDAEVELGYFTFPGYEHTRPSYANVGFHGGADRMQVEFTAPNALFPSGADWISVEAMLYVESFDEGVVDAELIRFESSREPRLHVTRSRWEGPIAFWTGYDDEVDITEAVPERAWIHLRLVQDTTTAYAFVDGKLVHSEPVSTLESWLAPRETFTLSIGQYYGWASNVIIKAGNGPLEIADSEREIVLGAPVVDLGSFVDIDVLDSYVPQAQVYSESNSSELIYHWSGSPGVVISDPAVLKPAVTFPGLGDHWLELEVRDSSGKRGRDEVRIRVINLSGNTAPTVDLGAPVSIRLPDAWVPSPVIADDGNPVGALSYFWMQLSGPSPAAISDPAVEAPSIHFTTEGVYVFEMTVSDSFLTEFDRIAVIVDDRRGPPRPGNSYVADADTIALYHFDGDLTDASGRGNDLMSEGATTAFASDTRWMASPAGASASFSDVGDQLSVTLPDSLIMPDLVPPDTTTELTLEWRYFARNDVAYSRESVTIVGLLQDYDALLDLSQDRWTVPTNGSVNFGQATVRAAFLEYYLPKGQWLEMKMTYRDDSADDDEGQGRLFINGQMVAERPVTFNHGRDSEWKLVLGNIDGLVDELRVSRVVRLDLPVNEPPLVAVDPWAHLTEPSAVTVQPPLVMDDGVSGDVLTYVWEVVGGSADNVRIADATLATPQVTFLAAGSYTLRVTVSDGEFTASGLSEWLVAFESPPILEPIGPKEIAEGGRLTFTASAHDKDVGDILTYSLEGVVPVGASMSPSGEFSWIPTDAQGPGVFTFDVVVTDNSSRLLSDRETITVRVAGSPFDAWIAEFFPGVSDPAIVGMAADPNADGWSNGLAFVLAVDPKVHQADRLRRQMADAVYSITEHGWSDRARALQPVVRFSTDMISWKEAIHGEDGVVIETLDDGFGRAADGSGIDRVTVKIPHRGGAIFTKLVLPMQP